jgi:hypothetical protein
MYYNQKWQVSQWYLYGIYIHIIEEKQKKVILLTNRLKRSKFYSRLYLCAFCCY